MKTFVVLLLLVAALVLCDGGDGKKKPVGGVKVINDEFCAQLQNGKRLKPSEQKACNKLSRKSSLSNRKASVPEQHEECKEVVINSVDVPAKAEDAPTEGEDTPVAPKKKQFCLLRFINWLRKKASRKRTSPPSPGKKKPVLLKQITDVDIEDLIKDPDNQPIPYFLKAMFEVLEDNYTSEGIFRLSGLATTVNGIIGRINSYNEVGVGSVNDIASAFKQYLRTMKNGFVPTDKSIQLVALTEESENKFEEIKAIIDNLGSGRSVLLNRIIQLCILIDSASNQNKMTVANLSIVFGPNVLPLPDVTDVRGNKAFEIIVNHYKNNAKE